MGTDNFNPAVTAIGNFVEVMFVFYAVIKHPYRTDFDNTFNTTDRVEFIKQGFELPVIKTIIAVKYPAAAVKAIAIAGFSHRLTRLRDFSMVAVVMCMLIRMLVVVLVVVVSDD